MKNYSRYIQKKEYQKKRQYDRMKKKITQEEDSFGCVTNRSEKWVKKLNNRWNSYICVYDCFNDGSDILCQTCSEII